MDALQREFGDELVILPLSLDRDGAPLVRNYYNDHDLITLPVMIDEKMKAGRTLRVHGIPATVFINADGAEVARVLGDRDWSDPDVIALGAPHHRVAARAGNVSATGRPDMDISAISIASVFAAGLISFLSPCVPAAGAGLRLLRRRRFPRRFTGTIRASPAAGSPRWC